ncbi:hypothetical protein PI125_g9310 [Phytophthora idaei]|nr:hypothetical protein PI125_g9310 [Phytophthora idaei]KAG3156807.1 hypothetical protein PI126_g8614 [Phytophthora idaei]
MTPQEHLLFLMTESTTRDFISQWPYDHGQSYDDVRGESTMQWRGVDRVAEQMRQREERHLEDAFATMDFETRAAALEAYFFQPPRHASFVSDRESPTARPVARVRPQSASLMRRAAENNGANNNKTRPQSAKARPEVPCSTNATQTESPAAWKAVAQQNPSKWREMLARGPEFEQLSLRRLELETYELLYNTLQQHHVIETKTTTRRRKRKDIAAKPQDCSPKLACGSGLHLARSRKRRQQEHDRQMMLGKGRESSRVNKADNKRAIQDKTRTRSKLVNKKKSQKPPESQQTRQVSAQETQQKTANLLRQSRTARGPWIPSGLSSSLANRGKAFETCEMQVSMEKRVARVLDAFRTEADTHLRLSRNVQTQLKAQQSARERRPRKTDLTLETSTAAKARATSTRPKSANATISRQTSNRSEQLHRNCSNQETEEPAAVEVKNPRPTQCALQSPDFGNETLLSESPATLTLVIPPLKLPAYLWEEQQTHDSFDSVSSDLSPVQNAVVRASNEPRMQSLELGVACEDPVSSIQSRASTNAATVAELKTSSEVKHDFVSPLGTSAKLDIADDLNAVKNEPEASCMDQDSGVDPIESANEENSYERQIVESTRQQFSVIVEEEYLAESLIEQASTGPSSENTEPSPTALRYEIPEQESAMTFPEKGCDDSNNLPGSGKDDDMNLWCTSNGDILAKPPRLHGEIKACDEEGAPNSSEERILVEDWMSPPQEISTWLPEDVNVTRSLSEKDSFATKESTLDVNNPEAGVTSAESDTDYVEQPVSVKHVVNKSPSSRIVEVGLGDTTDSVDISDSVVEMSPRAATDNKAPPYVGHAIQRSEQNVCGEKTSTSPEVILSGEVEETNTAAISSGLFVESKENKSAQEGSNSSGTTMSGNQFDQRNDGLSDPPLLTDSQTLLLDRSRSTESGETLQLLTDPSAMAQVTVVAQLATNETTDSLDLSDRVGDVQTPENNRHHSESVTGDEQRVVEHESTVSSNLLGLAMETLTDAATTQLTTTGATSPDSYHKMRELTDEHATVKTTSPSARSEPRSPKKKRTSKSKTTQKKPTMTARSANTAEISMSTSLLTQNSSLQAHVNSSALSDEDLLRLHQQTVTTPFLQRVSSRKIVEKDSDSIRLQPPQEEVESDDPLMLTTPAAMDVDSQLKQDDQPVKERDNIDRDAVSPREGLNDCESTVEKYPQVTEAPITTADLATTSPAEKVTSFTSVDDGSTSTSAVTDTEANPELVDPLGSVGQEPRPNPPSNSTGGDGEDLMQESSQVSLAIVDILVPPSPDATENVDQDPTQPWAEHHNAARKIQSQYRCFVRRQLILDQLRFMVAKKRRHTRRKTRQKVKKPKVVDMVTSASCLETESLVAVIAVDASSVDTILEEVQLVAPPSVSCAISTEMTPEPHSSEVPAEVVRVGARKGSSEYVFELFDDSVEVNKDMLDTATSRVEFMRSSTEKLDAQQQQNPATPPEKDAANSTKATTSIEVLQAEIVVSYQQPTLLPIEAIEVEPSIVNSRMLSELAFSDDVEKPAKPANAALVEAASEIAAMQPCWDRYVDSTTSKSFYYNPVTNETQWTAPDKDLDNAVINSPDKAAATGTDAVVSPSGQAALTQGTWQEFLNEASGQLYYYNTKTGECSWEPPSGDSPGVVESLQSVATAESAAIGASSWVMYIDPASQAPYYVNVETLATSWEQPDNFTVATVAGTTTANEDSYVIDDHVALEI